VNLAQNTNKDGNMNHGFQMQNDMDEYADVFTSSDEYASRFSGPAGQYLLSVQEKMVEDLLCPYSSASLLDIGGGHGQLLNLYERLGMDVILHGSSPVCFNRLSKTQHEKIKYIVSPPHAISLPDKSIDVVVSVRLLSHTDQWIQLIREMCRVARKAVIVDYPSTKSLNAFTPLLFNMKKRLEKNTRTYLSFNRKDLHGYFRECGFTEFSERAQFFLPMVVHRMGRGNIALKAAESFFRLTGLTNLLGSPIILRAASK